jgi:hypothetical protein
LPLGVLEASLRIIDWPAPGIYRDDRGPLGLSMPNEDGSSWRAYSGPARLRHWDYDVEIMLNKHGFIDRESYPKDPETWRIGIFGDSFVAGMGVSADERFTQVWIESISKRIRSITIETFNFGSAWCGSAQNAAFLSVHGNEYDLDEVVLAVFGGNELEDNLRWSEYSTLTPSEKVRADIAASSGTSIRDWIRNHSRAAGFLFVTIAGRFASKSIHIPDEDAMTKLWPTTEQALSSFALAAGNRKLTIWYLPDTHEWDDEAWRQIKSEFALREEDRHLVRDAIEKWAESRRILFIDASSFIAGRSARDLRFRRDGHWNEAGHRIVGEALAAHAEASWIQRINPAH